MGDKVNGVAANVVGCLVIVVMLRPRHAVDFKRWLRLLYRWRKRAEII